MKLTYRPEIDGLRAIAVTVVILYHAQITIFGHHFFKGGFIGVDIFFVISGYLITSIILKELLTTGSFSFKYFYERRIRRLLPVLLLVMLVTMPFAWMYLVPSNFIDFSRSILYSILFSSNFYFHYAGQQYGAASGFLEPFLHTWSLSVEEQFYIIFPIVLLITFKYFKKHLLIILVAGLIISLTLADWGSKNYPSASFYFLHTRMWELLAGSILAYSEITLGHRSKNKTLNMILPCVGTLLIGYSVVFFNHEMFHPSIFTLSPIVGVCLIIWFSEKNEIITKILSSKLLVGIGLISYSLYLWHYPIFTFLRISETTPEGNIFYKILIGVFIIIISILSYYFLEKPMRDKKINFKKVFILSFIFIMVLFPINLSVIKTDGYSLRVPEILKNQDLTIQPWMKLKNLQGEICHENLDKSFDSCKFNVKSKKKIYILGDSHIASLSFKLKERLVQNGYQILFQNECSFFPGFDLIENKSNQVNPKCNNKNWSSLRDYLNDEKNSIIVLGGRFPLYLNQKPYSDNEGNNEALNWNSKFVQVGKYRTIQDSFKSEVLKLSKNNKIILIYPIPEMGFNPKSKIFSEFVKRKKFTNEKFKVSNLSVSYEFYKIRTKSSFELLDSIENNNIYRIYPHKLFCDTLIKDRCIAHDGKNLFYFDDDHPSEKGANLINNLIVDEIKKINK